MSKSPIKSIALATSLALGGGGAVFLATNKDEPAPDPHAWLTEPAVWIEETDDYSVPLIVWLQTADAGTVNAGRIEDVLQNYPQFNKQILAAIEEYKARLHKPVADDAQ